MAVEQKHVWSKKNKPYNIIFELENFRTTGILLYNNDIR